MQKKIKGLIFDCDGVLIDSRHANITYYNQLLITAGYQPMTKPQEDFVHMASVTQAIEHIFGQEKIEKIEEIAKSVPYKKVVLPLLELEPDLRPCLDWLKKQGFALAVHTNRGLGMFDVIDKFGLQGVFDPVITVDRAEPKPSSDGVLQILDEWGIASNELVFIGDSSADAQAAKAASVDFISYRNKELDALLTINNFSELLNFVKLNS